MKVPNRPIMQELDHVPTLVAVGLGGATGPAPKAMLDQAGQDYADVPLPSLAARLAGAGRRRCRRARVRRCRAGRPACQDRELA